MEKRPTIISLKKVLPIFLIFFVVLQFFFAFFTYQHTLTFDEAMWQYIGRNWFRNGLTPYAGGVDNKSPLIFSIFGFSDRLFGVNFWFPRMIGIAFQTVGVFFIYKMTDHLFGRREAILAISVYGLSLLWHATGGKYVSYTESYSVAFIIAAFYYAISSQKNSTLFISGILCGLAIVFRLTAFFGTLAIFISLIINRKKIPFPFLSGITISIFVLLIIFSLCGVNLHDVYIYQFIDNFSSGGVTDHPISWKLNSLADHFSLSGLALFAPVLVTYFIFHKTNYTIIIWLVAEFVGISIIGLYSNQHFKDLLPPLALITAATIINLIDRFNISYRAALLLSWILFFPKSLEPFICFKNRLFISEKKIDVTTENINTQPDDNRKEMIGLWVKSNTHNNDRVLVAGYGSIIQAYSERISPTIFFNVTQTEIAKKTFFEDVNKNNPAMILIPVFSEYNGQVQEEIRLFIEELAIKRYHFEKKLFGYAVYRKNNQF